MPKKDAKILFKEIGAIAKPHHTFYVLGMYSEKSTSRQCGKIAH